MQLDIMETNLLWLTRKFKQKSSANSFKPNVKMKY